MDLPYQSNRSHYELVHCAVCKNCNNNRAQMRYDANGQQEDKCHRYEDCYMHEERFGWMAVFFSVYNCRWSPLIIIASSYAERWSLVIVVVIVMVVENIIAAIDTIVINIIVLARQSLTSPSSSNSDIGAASSPSPSCRQMPPRCPPKIAFLALPFPWNINVIIFFVLITISENDGFYLLCN